MVRITKVSCQGCGSPLSVNESIRYATCNHCGASLEIIHDPSVTHSRLLEKLEQRTDALANGLKVLQLQNDLELLDREWDRFRDKICDREENGQLIEPSDRATKGVGVLAMIVGAFLLIASVVNGSPGMGVVVGIALAVIAGIATASSGSPRVKEYLRMRDRYHRRRGELLGEIARLRKSAMPIPVSHPRSPEPVRKTTNPIKRAAMPSRIRPGQP
ncbi:MAG: hypothetical protein QM755_23370 [Luteolibacter sp.]